MNEAGSKYRKIPPRYPLSQKIKNLGRFIRFVIHPKRLSALVQCVAVEDLRYWLESYAFRNDDRWKRDNARPWMVFEAINELERIIMSRFRVFEYGAGTSSIWFARRCRAVTSVEWNPAWAEKVKRWLEELKIQNVQVKIRPHMKDSPGRSICAEGVAVPCECEYDHLPFTSQDGTAPYGDYYEFATAIDDEPDESVNVVIVDSWARIPCVYLAYNKITPGGYLVLDNSDWDYYKPVQDWLVHRGWTKWEFKGHGPYDLSVRWATSIFQKPAHCEKIVVQR